MKRRLVLKTISALFVISMVTSLLSVQTAKAVVGPIIEFESFGDGTVEWTTEVAHIGSYSVKLLIPEGASTGSWAIVKVPYGDSLGTLEQFSFYVKYVAARPRFAIYLDKNRDGSVDSLLLSDYLDFGDGEWTVGVGGLRWGWTEATYPITMYGEVWQPYEYWQELYGDAIVLYVAAALEYWSAGIEGFGEPLYVDTVTINTLTYDLEPIEKPLPTRAAELAKEVIRKNYVWGAKGFLEYWDGIKTVYRFLSSEEVKGVDCSGLIFWAYNRAYYGDKILSASEWEERPLYYFSTDGQWNGNVERFTKREELEPGNLLFFDAYADSRIGEYKKPGQDGHIDHVVMYVGQFSYYSENYDVVESTPPTIIATTVDKVITRITKLAGEGAFKGFGRVIEPKIGMKVIGKSSGYSIDLIVTDPESITVTKELAEVLGMYYMEYDIDGDGKLDDVVTIPERKIGDYLVQVVPELDAIPTDIYNLEVIADAETIVLAVNVSINNIPVQPYIIRSTETEIIPIIPATIDFDPDTLNLKSKGQWVTVYIELPVGHGYSVSMINLASVLLNGQVLAEVKPIEIGDYDGDGIPDLMVKFNRAAVQNILEVGEKVEIIMSGKLMDGRLFEGREKIRVISQG